MTRVLVVDDIEPNVTLLSAKLRRAQFSVLSANSGLGAIAAAEAEQPDIILLDVMMPEMDGFEACSIIKSRPSTRDIPVIMVTALDRDSDRAEGVAAGANGYITKPVNDAVLFSRIRELTGDK